MSEKYENYPSPILVFVSRLEWFIFIFKSKIYFTNFLDSMRARDIIIRQQTYVVYLTFLKSLKVQGPPYLLARYRMAILSICSDNFQNIFFTKQGSGGSKCLYGMVF